MDGKALYTNGMKINSTTVMFTLVNVQTPPSFVLCKLKYNSKIFLVSGLDLDAGRRCTHLSTSCVLLTLPFILCFVPLSSSSSRQAAKYQVWNVEELAISGVLVGARAENTPQHRLQCFCRQVRWLCSVFLAPTCSTAAQPAKPLCLQGKRDSDTVGRQLCRNRQRNALSTRRGW